MFETPKAVIKKLCLLLYLALVNALRFYAAPPKI